MGTNREELLKIDAATLRIERREQLEAQDEVERWLILMAQIDDLMAAVAADQAATDSAAALLDSLQASVATLQQQVVDLQATIDANQPPDLTAITAQVQAMADQLTTAEAPPEPAPVEPPPVEPPPA